MGNSVKKSAPRPRGNEGGSLEAPGSSNSPSLINKSRGPDSKLELGYVEDAEYQSYKQWHRLMQEEHEMKFGPAEASPKFSIWGWCNCFCAPCRYIEEIDYTKKICRCCLKYRTFKAWTTGFFLFIFAYLVIYHVLEDKILPGGTYFYLMIMFVMAFLVGNILFSFGIPGTIGQMVVGIVFANLPYNIDEDETIHVVAYSEKSMVLIILIRAALLLDFGHLQKEIPIITQLTLLPFCSEFLVVLFCSHYLLHLPWTWSALQAILVSPMSLASALFGLDKFKALVLKLETKLPTILMAVGSFHIIITIYIYGILIAVLFSKGIPWISAWWMLLLVVIVQLIGGIAVGVFMGCLAGMFPDRRSHSAPYCRILFIGLGTLALVTSFHKLGATGVGVLAASTMVVVASNIWEELGWHDSTQNPVISFYSLLYFLAQPIAVSLVGFTVKFRGFKIIELVIGAGIIFLGTATRELVCLGVLQNRRFHLKKAEIAFLTICYLSKGTAEALLAAVLSDFVRENYMYISNNEHSLDDLLIYVSKILHTTVCGMLFTTTASTLLMAFVFPLMFQKEEQTPT